MFDSSISKEQVGFLLSRERQGGLCCVTSCAKAAWAIVGWLHKGKPPPHRGFCCFVALLMVLCCHSKTNPASGGLLSVLVHHFFVVVLHDLNRLCSS